MEGAVDKVSDNIAREPDRCCELSSGARREGLASGSKAASLHIQDWVRDNRERGNVVQRVDHLSVDLGDGAQPRAREVFRVEEQHLGPKRRVDCAGGEDVDSDGTNRQRYNRLDVANGVGREELLDGARQSELWQNVEKGHVSENAQRAGQR